LKLREKNEFKVIVLIILFGLGLRLAGSALFPVWSGPEEGAHIFYIEFIGDNARLPMIPLTHETLASISNESLSQPPLFHSIAAIFYIPIASQSIDTIVHVLRLLSVAFGTACILLTYIIAKKLNFGKIVRLGSAMFVALLPTHIITSATVSNGTLSWLLCLVVIYYSIKVFKEKKTKDMAIAGLFMAGVLLTMLTGLAVAVTFGIAWFVFLFKGKEKLWKRILACSVPLLGIVTFYRYLLLSGNFFPSFLKPMMAIDIQWLAYFLTYLFAGMWLQEYGTATIPEYRFVFFGFYAIVSIVALIGFVKLILGNKWNNKRKKLITAVLILPILLNLAGVAYINFFVVGPDARWMFGTVGLIAILFIAGLLSFMKTIRQEKWAKTFVWIVLSSMLLFDIVLLINYNPILVNIIWNVPI